MDCSPCIYYITCFFLAERLSRYCTERFKLQQGITWAADRSETQSCPCHSYYNTSFMTVFPLCWPKSKWRHTKHAMLVQKCVKLQVLCVLSSLLERQADLSLFAKTRGKAQLRYLPERLVFASMLKFELFRRTKHMASIWSIPKKAECFVLWFPRTHSRGQPSLLPSAQPQLHTSKTHTHTHPCCSHFIPSSRGNCYSTP